MDNRKELTEARKLFLELLAEKGAKDIIKLDESDEIFPIAWQVQAILDGRWINALFTLVEGGDPKITFYHKDINEKDLSFKEFVQVMASIEVSKPEGEDTLLESYEVADNEELRIRRINGITTLEKHSCEDSLLTPNDIYCLARHPELHVFTYLKIKTIHGFGIAIPCTEKNTIDHDVFVANRIQEEKIEVSAEEFINICKK